MSFVGKHKIVTPNGKKFPLTPKGVDKAEKVIDDIFERAAMLNKRGTIDRKKQAQRIAAKEGGALNLSIAQIDEVIRLMYIDLKQFKHWEVNKTIDEPARKVKRNG